MCLLTDICGSLLTFLNQSHYLCNKLGKITELAIVAIKFILRYYTNSFHLNNLLLTEQIDYIIPGYLQKYILETPT